MILSIPMKKKQLTALGLNRNKRRQILISRCNLFFIRCLSLFFLQTVDGSTSNMDDLFAAFNDDVRHVVRHTAKMAVLSSQEEQAIDRNDSVREFITQREGRS